MSENRDPRPVHLLTGYLGSGKTTLLARLLRDPALADTAVIINELGEVGLDHVLVDRSSEDDVVLLDSGCLCCALGNSLQETLESLHYRRERGELPPFARVVIETTGVADPGPIAATLALDSAIVRHYRLGSIVTVVDAVHGDDELDRFVEARRQVAMADRIVVTKTDAAPTSALRRLEARLAALAPHAVRRSAVHGGIAADEVFVDMLRSAAVDALCADRPTPAAEHAHDATCAHGADAGSTGAHDLGHDGPAHPPHLVAGEIVTTSIRLMAPLAWPRYAEWVRWMQRSFGERLLRMKGAVRMDDGSAQALHAVLRLFNAPVPLPALPPELGDGVVVVIAQHVSPTLLAEARQRLADSESVVSS
ncbi:MAG: GTP-binding protein [Burkholderiales bacterium]|nr:GTP-binding protein [Burkholderiales bacterium]